MSRRAAGEEAASGAKPETGADWLLEEDEPSIRYLALTQLLGRSEKDPEVKAAKKKIGAEGLAAEIL
ncbi:MAG: hypothetical protein ACRD6W_06145, partial [Nitrososphaerales archaeon]